MTIEIKLEDPQTQSLKPQQIEWNLDKAKMKLAASILYRLFVLFLLSILIALPERELGMLLIDICKTSILPIVTFILGYYFSHK